MKTKLLIDSNNLCHIAHYSTGDLSVEEKRTGVIFGFLKKILSLSKIFNTNDFVFCFDSKKSYRKLIYPKYKANRNKNLTGEEKKERSYLYEQIDLLKKEVLFELGFNNIFYKVGYEGDDLLAWLAKNIDGKVEKVIVSTDEDLFQLLFNVKWIHNPIKKTNKSEGDFFAEYGLHCDRWANVKAIVGGHDNINGINGIGVKTAVKFLCGAILQKSNQWEKITGNYAKIEFNKKLVTLPFEGRVEIDLKLRDNSFRKDNFIKVFDRYRFYSFLKDNEFDSWVKQFELR